MHTGLFLHLGYHEENYYEHFYVFVWAYDFIFLGYIQKSVINRSYGNSMFNFFGNCQNVFQSGHTILHSHQQCMKDLFSLHPCQHLLSDFLIIVGVKMFSSF
jgi:hypothetical protein